MRFFQRLLRLRRRRRREEPETTEVRAASVAAEPARASPSETSHFLLRVAMGAGANADQAHILIASNGMGDLIFVDGRGVGSGGLLGVRPGSLELAGVLAALTNSDARLATALVESAREHEENHRMGPPPTAPAVLAKLPIVEITASDLEQDGNERCCVCLEKQKVGDKALRLPCGHLYHEACARTWLAQHCTCPNCRYELPTEDCDYEPGRKARMRHRRPRYRLAELQRLTVCELRDLMRDADLEASCPHKAQAEKRDLVRSLIDAKAIELVAEAIPVRVDVDAHTMRDWSKAQLQDLADRVALDATNCPATTDLADALLASGKVLPSPTGA